MYPDGQPGGCTVVGPTTIQLVTAPTQPGVFDAVVIDASGVEGRETNAYSFFSVPVIASVFPTAGSASGGTSVVITGSDFVSGCTVSIDGVAQTQVTVDDPTRITLVTDAGVAGGPYTLSVMNAGGGTSSASFSYTVESDPSLLSVSPPGGTTSGGDSITLAGANLPANATVVFGADPDTGLGGVPATSVTWIDATTIDVVTPTHGSGTVSVLVRDPVNGQATVLPAAYAFASTGGGGGGCSLAPAGTPRSPFDPLAGSAWILAVASILLLRARRPRAESRTA